MSAWAELYEEIDRLSERHRSALVLCDLESLTHEQAAERLGCPVKTVQGRLYRARELLRNRLIRRGITTTLGMMSATIAHRTASAAPSTAWVQDTARTAAQIAAGQGVERILSAQSAELFRCALRATIMTKLKIVALGGLVLTATAAGMAMAWGTAGKPGVVEQPPENDPPAVAIAAAAPLDPTAAQQGQDPPAVAAAAPRDPAAVKRKQNNVKQVGLAMYNYLDAHGRLPAPAIQGPDGKPLLSWRVAILPYLDENELYQSFKLDEPWDSPHNKPLLERMPYLYAAAPQPPSQAQGSLTPFRVFIGQGTPFEGGRGPRLADITDGLDQTILVVEADESVPWTKPDELPYAPDKPLPALRPEELRGAGGQRPCPVHPGKVRCGDVA